MQVDASRSLKYAYALVILAAINPLSLAKSGWVALATGGGGMGIPYIGPILFLALGLYRVVTVFRNPHSLCSYEVTGFARLLRQLGTLALYLGALIGVISLFSFPLMSLLMTKRTGTGVEFFAVGLYLALLGGVGSLGIMSFELSRLLGLEEHARVAGNP